ncbi:hypothetical protein P7K49_018639 [Saguinus oedipus]|uniref:Uncharacterized protein n=1 Tax=Saguinus oedipus TaxID=9490 RepID=A0ABQ9V7Z0_SAGOE|nr:hypothetical protein P7K49_018639 [Saguinus oedipus]
MCISYVSRSVLRLHSRSRPCYRSGRYTLPPLTRLNPAVSPGLENSANLMPGAFEGG